MHQSRIRAFVCLLWAVGILMGLHELNAYSTTPSFTPAAMPPWPHHTQIPLASNRPTLVLTLHPRCACSRATIHEFARLVSRLPTSPQLIILLYRPMGIAPSWAETSLVEQARRIPGVRLVPDPDGQEAARRGMPVSGHATLYSRTGQVLFSGGLTYARGHEGENEGSAAVFAIMAQRYPAVTQTPVFGCSTRQSPQ